MSDALYFTTCIVCGGDRYQKSVSPGRCQFCYRKHKNGKQAEIERGERAGARMVLGKCSMLANDDDSATIEGLAWAAAIDWEARRG